MVCLSQSIFQGAYSTLVSYLPIKKFTQGISGVGRFQVFASAGIILGFIVLWIYPDALKIRHRKLNWKSLSAFLGALLLLYLTISSDQLTESLFLFFGMNALYEVLWLNSSAEFFRSSPAQAVARFNFSINSVAAVLMSSSTLVFSYTIQNYSRILSFGATVTFNLSALAIAYFYIKRSNSLSLPKAFQ